MMYWLIIINFEHAKILRTAALMIFFFMCAITSVTMVLSNFYIHIIYSSIRQSFEIKTIETQLIMCSLFVHEARVA